MFDLTLALNPLKLILYRYCQHVLMALNLWDAE